MSFAEGWSHLEISGDIWRSAVVIRCVAVAIFTCSGIGRHPGWEWWWRRSRKHHGGGCNQIRSFADHLLSVNVAMRLWLALLAPRRPETESENWRGPKKQPGKMMAILAKHAAISGILYVVSFWQSWQLSPGHWQRSKHFSQFSLVWSLRVGTIHSRYCELGSQESCCCLRTCFVETQEVLIHVPFLQTTFSLS